jgi:SDR family mycofactocin-dependent oxidoreductase
MGRVEGKVAFITGVARGQGRSHAIRLAEEGADIIGIDVCDQLDTVLYPMATKSDLEETEKLVQAVGGRIVTSIGDVRSSSDLDTVVEKGLNAFGHIDIVSANAGIANFAPFWELTEHQWQETIDVNLTGVWLTMKAVTPTMIEQNTGGSIIITSSSGGRKGIPNSAHYVSAKHGVVGLMRGCANELARFGIRVNTVHPTGVDTILIQNESTYRLFCPDLETPTREDAARIFRKTNALPIPWVEPVDISNMVLFLASDEASYIPGSEFPVDAGFHGRVR